ncbi:MAG: polyamine ABC transporter substrate-binding protein [Gammaproteobacteria bacterium]|nr:polyamine ABC transporter substrate-binding protein [Gammaproteobacteria bacterium]
MPSLSRGLAAAVITLCASVAGAAEPKVVNVYNWSDYIAEDTLENFTRKTGVKVTYDVYDANETLEAKLLAGRSGYDVIFPSAQPFAQRHIAGGVYRPLDRAKLPHYKNLDPEILKALEKVDPGNQHVVPYMWGTTGIGYNVAKVQEVLGEKAPVDSLRMLFDPEVVSKLAGCGVTLMDDEAEAFGAALIYLGKNPNTTDAKDIEAAAELITKVRPHIRYFHSSQYINDLANGDVCVAQGYSGDVLQARDRAEEAGNDVEVGYSIPKEGAILWFDVMAIPKDAPHPDNAHAFIDFLLRPDVIADVTNYVSYANPNLAATKLVDEEIRNDPSIYPPKLVRARLVTSEVPPAEIQRLRTRTWTRVKTGR